MAILNYSAAAAWRPPCQEELFYSTAQFDAVKLAFGQTSFAVMVIFAFNTLETGQPFSAASAYF
jgi:hypothetical protein